MKPVVIGGTGFVGMNLVRYLVQQGYEVTATRRVRANTLFARKLGAKLVCAELDDVDSLVQAMRGCDVAFHCAGYYPRYSLDMSSQVQRANKTTDNVLKAVRKSGVKRLILTSSVATIGRALGGREFSTEQDPIWEKAQSSVYFSVKRAIEQQVMQASDIDCVVVCPSGILGELDVKVGTGFGIVALAHGRLPYYVQGKTSVVDADDVAQALEAAALRGACGERYIVNGHNLMVKQLLEMICHELDLKFFSWQLPMWLALGLSTLDEARCAARKYADRPFIAREFVDLVRFGQWFDNSKATVHLGLGKPTELEQTIRKACRWYRRFHYIP